MYGIIYKITNKINAKIYIGQTVQSLAARWYNHLQFAKHIHLKGRSKIARAINKYGEDSFIIETIAEAHSKEELDLLEIKFIEDFNSILTGYNLKTGGANGKPSEETRKRMSDTQKRIGNQPPHTPESIEKMRQTKLGQPSKRKGLNNTHERSKPCIVNGTIYQSPSKAAKSEGICKTTLISWLTGRTKAKIQCEFLYEEHRTSPKPKRTAHNARPIIIDGVEYSSINHAVKDLKKGKKSIRLLAGL